MDKVEAALEKQLPFWSQLSEAERATLIAHTKIMRYSPGDNIRGYNIDPGILLIQNGALRSYLLSEDGKAVNVYRLKPGEVCVLSASSIIEAISFDLYIDASEESEVFVIPVKIFAKLAENNIHVENFLHKKATARLSDVVTAVEKMIFVSLETRLTDFLLSEARETASVEIHMTHEELAGATGSAREVISRTLKRMEEQGKITLFRGGLKLNKDFADQNRISSRE
jgi:CRP/FNR family transcriptional regulator